MECNPDLEMNFVDGRPRKFDIDTARTMGPAHVTMMAQVTDKVFAYRDQEEEAVPQVFLPWH